MDTSALCDVGTDQPVVALDSLFVPSNRAVICVVIKRLRCINKSTITYNIPFQDIKIALHKTAFFMPMPTLHPEKLVGKNLTFGL